MYLTEVKMKLHAIAALTVFALNLPAFAAHSLPHSQNTVSQQPNGEMRAGTSDRMNDPTRAPSSNTDGPAANEGAMLEAGKVTGQDMNTTSKAPGRRRSPHSPPERHPSGKTGARK